jgi:hypothetical protein
MAEFASTITNLNNGSTETELSLAFKSLVAAVSDTGRKGTLTLKLTVEQNKKNAKLIEIAAEVSCKPPQPKPQAAAFLLHQGELIALEDTQMRLPLERQIDGPVVEVQPARQIQSPGFTQIEVNAQ